MRQGSTLVTAQRRKGGSSSPVPLQANLTLHGLRHSRGVELALAGASDSEIMSQLEHADSRTAQIYRWQAERRQLADSAQAKINESIRRRVARKAAEAASDNLVS